MVKGKEYVRPHKWKKGKRGTHPGYWRPKRPKGKKRKIDNKPTRLYAIRDEYGHILGYRSKRK